MRFHVLNNELDAWEEQREKEREEKQKKKKKGEEETKGAKEDSEDDDDDQMTAAKLFNQKIIERANIGQFAGEIVCSIQDLPMLIPRGNYSLDFYSNLCKLHGKTHDYKIMFKDINKIFLLQKPDGVNMVQLFHLDQPLRQGQTLHHYIALNFELEREVRVKLNLTPEEIKKKYGDSLQPEIEGKLCDVLSQLFINLVGIKKIIVPGDFLSSRGAKAIKCSVKAAEGYLYPLKSSIVFIHKPVLYIRHSELRFVEFSRIGQGSSGLSRSFDVTLTKLADDSKVTFMSIDKEEQACLMNYFKASNVKMRTVDLETNIHEDLGSEDEEPSQENDRGAGKRKIKKKKVEDEEMEDYDDEEDDEDFDDDGDSGSGSDEEQGEEEEDSAMIDASISGDELKHLDKVDVNAQRPKRKRN